MSFTFLGVGAAINSSLHHTSLLLNDVVLIDAPPSANIICRKLHVDLHRLELIFITHLHADHFFGLPLLLTEFMIAPRNRPLHIVGPPGLERATLDLMEAAFPESDVGALIELSKSRFFELTEDDQRDIAGMCIRPLLVRHGTVPTFGLIVSFGQTTTLFSADTEYFSEFEESIAISDICILDGTTADFTLAGHMNFAQITNIAENHPDIWFFVTHRSNYVVPDHPQNILIPSDGDSFKICAKTTPKLIYPVTSKH